MQLHSFEFTILSWTLCIILDQLDLTASNGNMAWIIKETLKPHSINSSSSSSKQDLGGVGFAVPLYFVNKLMCDFHLIKTTRYIPIRPYLLCNQTARIGKNR